MNRLLPAWVGLAPLAAVLVLWQLLAPANAPNFPPPPRLPKFPPPR